MKQHPAKHSTPRLDRDLLRDFLELDRQRALEGALPEQSAKRWEELRWQIEVQLAGDAGSERPARRALRVPTDLAVGYSDADHAEAHSRAREIAERGMFLATPTPPAVGTPLNLKLRDDAGVIEIKGRVVWVRNQDSEAGPAGAGVEFSDLGDEQREAVCLLVQEALAAL